jgi:nitroimidazol reductase NimA-like FMN-containing flavoprotein (pyridoxamine 5'-phosphate oxidase superfamily)
MLIDQRGSEVLERSECARLLAVKAGGVGRLGIVVQGQPVVVPLNYEMVDGDVVIRIGSGSILETITDSQTIVAFEVDDHSQDEASSWWSVLVQGLALAITDRSRLVMYKAGAPTPAIPTPGESLVRIRPDVLSGRRFQTG